MTTKKTKRVVKNTPEPTRIPYTLKSIYNVFSHHEESRWIMQPENAQALHSFVKAHPIKHVLELGTGIGLSTAIIAYSLEEKGVTDYVIHTVEQSEKCLALAKQLIPLEFQKRIVFHLSEATTWKPYFLPNTELSIFEKLPDDSFDLVLVDGPGPWLKGEHLVDLDNGDVIKLLLEEKLKPGALVAWDGRVHALQLVERYFGDNFYFVPTASYAGRMNVIERKGNVVQCRDDKLESMRLDHYFDV